MPVRYVKQIVLLLAMSILVTQSYADDKQTLQVGTTTRSYVVRVPDCLKPSLHVPLVIVLHGGGNVANAEKMTGFTDKGHQEGFIVVYPEGSGRFRNTLLTWNAGHCCYRENHSRRSQTLEC
jgi:polyhydroxybutyrate depolymerase